MTEPQITPEGEIQKQEIPAGDKSVDDIKEVVAPVPSPEQARLQAIADRAVQEKQDDLAYWKKQAEMEKDPSKKLEAERRAFDSEKSLFEMTKDLPQAPTIDSTVESFKAEFGVEPNSDLDQIFQKARAQGPDDYKEIATFAMNLLRAANPKTKIEPTRPVDISRGPQGEGGSPSAIKTGDIFSDNVDTKKAAKESLMNTIRTLANKGRL